MNYELLKPKNNSYQSSVISHQSTVNSQQSTVNSQQTRVITVTSGGQKSLPGK